MSLISEYKLVNRLVKEEQQVVFYAETRHHYQYFEKLLSDLLIQPGARVTYITSDAMDPLLNHPGHNLEVVYVKWMLGFLFSRLRARIVIMTMPDLDNYLFKRSPSVGSYIYMFHAAVSTHQQYRKKAFFHYDAIFCTGPYQQDELRKAEIRYGTKPKDLISYGYPLLDKLSDLNVEVGIKNRHRILLAPSWFEGCIFDICLEPLLKELSDLPCEVLVRSHPEFEKRKKKEFSRIRKLVASYNNMSMDKTPDVLSSLRSANYLITDRSGIALEFAFGIKRPVLFIDTLLKETNPAWKELEIEPLENSIRSEIGIAVEASNLNQLGDKLKELELMANGFEMKIEKMGRELFFNSPSAYTKGLEYVVSKIGKP